MYIFRSSVTTGLLLAILLAHAVPAQVSVYSQHIGGPGTLGSEGGDPPVLSDGSAATGTLDYVYQRDARLLMLCVTNTTPQVVGEDNPIIKTVFFNLPRHTNVSLILHSQSAPAAVTPSFSMVVDTNLDSPPHQNPADGFGGFAIGLISNLGVQGGIANAAANRWAVPTANLVFGKTTFTFEVKGSDAAHLTAADFALSPSAIPAGDMLANAVFKFQAGGVLGDGSAFIGTQADCVPGLWYAGKVHIGKPFRWVLGLGSDCHACLLFSKDPTPFSLFGIIEIPLSPPLRVLWSGLTSVEAQQVIFNIPTDPSLFGFEGYLTLVSLAGAGTELEDVLFSPVVPFTILGTIP